MKFELLSEMVEANGKTVRENNLSKMHAIPLGTLVEVIPWDSECGFGGVRLFVTKQTRDCDGSPLYSLGVPGKDYAHGFSGDHLAPVVRGNE